MCLGLNVYSHCLVKCLVISILQNFTDLEMYKYLFFILTRVQNIYNVYYQLKEPAHLNKIIHLLLLKKFNLIYILMNMNCFYKYE